MKRTVRFLVFVLFATAICLAQWESVLSTSVSAGGFTPPAGTFAWYKADALGLSNNDPVASWTDSSGSGNTSLQTTAGFKPTYKTNQQNNLPMVQYDGADDFTQSGSFSAQAQPSAMHCVVKITNRSSSQYVTDGTDPHRHMCYFTTANNSMAGYAGSTMTGDGNTLPDTAAHQITIVFNGASSTVFVDGSSAGTGDVGSQTIDTITLGAAGGTAGAPGGFGAVSIGEVIWSPGGRSLTTEAYLKAKWATP